MGGKTQRPRPDCSISQSPGTEMFLLHKPFLSNFFLPCPEHSSVTISVSHGLERLHSEPFYCRERLYRSGAGGILAFFVAIDQKGVFAVSFGHGFFQTSKLPSQIVTGESIADLHYSLDTVIFGRYKVALALVSEVVNFFKPLSEREKHRVLKELALSAVKLRELAEVRPSSIE